MNDYERQFPSFGIDNNYIRHEEQNPKISICEVIRQKLSSFFYFIAKLKIISNYKSNLEI